STRCPATPADPGAFAPRRMRAWGIARNIFTGRPGDEAPNRVRGRGRGPCGGSGRPRRWRRPDGKVTICHRTGSDTNPIVVITIQERAAGAPGEPRRRLLLQGEVHL